MAVDIEQVEMLLMESEEKMEKTVSVLKEEYIQLRIGRANPHVLDKVLVDYYGEMTPINQTANISVQDGKCLVISPWDKSLIKNMEKGITIANIGLTPSNDGNVIRLVFPDLTSSSSVSLNVNVLHASSIGSSVLFPVTAILFSYKLQFVFLSIHIYLSLKLFLSIDYIMKMYILDKIVILLVVLYLQLFVEILFLSFLLIIDLLIVVFIVNLNWI